MIFGTIFKFGSEVIEVRIIGEKCLFKTNRFGEMFAPIEGLHLDKKGVISEFPDLKESEDWKEQAIERFKMKIKKLKTEQGRMNYVIDDLKKHGYTPLYQQRKGFRPKRF